MNIHPRWNTKDFCFEEDDVIVKRPISPQGRKFSLGAFFVRALIHLLVGVTVLLFVFIFAMLYLSSVR